MEIAVIGDGGHSKVIRDIIRSSAAYKLIAVLDDKYERLTQTGDEFRGPVSSAPMILQQSPDIQFIVAIGSNKLRKSLVSLLGFPEERYISLIHPNAVVSPSAAIGRGSVIMANAVIQADIRVGNHVIINTGAIVEHDNQIDDYAHAAPRATLTGSVHVKEGAMIGAGAIVIPGKSVGEWAVVGAGATVIGDIPDHCTAVGTPAKLLYTDKEVRRAHG